MPKNYTVLQGKQTQYAAFGNQPVLYIWDRIINIRLNRADGKSGLVIRSDYEARAIRDSSGNERYFFCRMEQKPDIKIKYQQQTGGLATRINVEITNLYTYLQGADKANEYSQANNPFTTITVEMGYFSNFDDFADSQGRAASSGATDLIDKLALQYGDAANGSGSRRFIRTIDARILSMYQSKPAPDAITTINCVVGDISTAYNPNPYRKKSEAKDVVINKGGSYEDMFFRLVSKRFVSKAINNTMLEKPLDANGGKVTIEGKSFDFSGTLSDSDAAKYGVKVFITESLKNSKIENGLLESPVVDNAEQMLLLIQRKILPSIRFIQTTDGNYIAWDKRVDSLDDARKQFFGNDIVDVIPAVYNVSLGALRMVSCPFFSFVNPFTLISFNARYSASNMIGTFYKPQPGNDTFMALKCQITFATCDDDNEVLLTSTDEEAKHEAI